MIHDITRINAERERFRTGFTLALHIVVWALCFCGLTSTSLGIRSGCLAAIAVWSYAVGKRAYHFIEACRDVRALRRGR